MRRRRETGFVESAGAEGWDTSHVERRNSKTGGAVFWFFFSSRRRHTRFDCDWSSDVCSSDLFVVLVVADQRLANAVVREQLLRVARVFARDLIGFFEDAQSAQRDVLQVADRRPHKVQTARGSLWLSGRIVGGHGDQSSMRGSARAPAAGRSLYKNAAASRQAL